MSHFTLSSSDSLPGTITILCHSCLNYFPHFTLSSSGYNFVLHYIPHLTLSSIVDNISAHILLCQVAKIMFVLHLTLSSSG